MEEEKGDEDIMRAEDFMRAKKALEDYIRSKMEMEDDMKSTSNSRKNWHIIMDEKMQMAGREKTERAYWQAVAEENDDKDKSAPLNADPLWQKVMEEEEKAEEDFARAKKALNKEKQMADKNKSSAPPNADTTGPNMGSTSNPRSLYDQSVEEEKAAEDYLGSRICWQIRLHEKMGMASQNKSASPNADADTTGTNDKKPERGYWQTVMNEDKEIAGTDKNKSSASPNTDTDTKGNGTNNKKRHLGHCQFVMHGVPKKIPGTQIEIDEAEEVDTTFELVDGSGTYDCTLFGVSEQYLEWLAKELESEYR